MEFRLLGPIEAIRDVRSLPLGGAKPRALLALLLLHANEVVSRDRLIEALWPGRPPGSRRAQPGCPGLAAPEGVRAGRAPRSREAAATSLEVEPDAIDAARFERLLDEGRRANAAGEPADAAAVARACSRALARAGSGGGRLRGLRARRARSGSRSSDSWRPRNGSTLGWRSASTTCSIAELEALDRASPPARAAPRAAHACALPRRAAGGGAARRTRRRARARGGARDRARSGAPRARAGDPAPGSGARLPRVPRVEPAPRPARWVRARSCWQPLP